MPHENENEALAGFTRRPPGRPTVRQAECPIGGRFGVAIDTRFGEILRAATEAFARRGDQQASIREIARSAGLSLAGPALPESG